MGEGDYSDVCNIERDRAAVRMRDSYAPMDLLHKRLHVKRTANSV
jgi:hypothetical protein